MVLEVKFGIRIYKSIWIIRPYQIYIWKIYRSR